MFVSLGLTPFVMAMTAERWFWRLIPLFGKLYEKKISWDKELVALPQDAANVTIKTLREQNSLGSKITVTHHLAAAANDVKVQIQRAHVLSFIFAMLGTILSVSSAIKTTSGGAASASAANPMAPGSAAAFQSQFIDNALAGLTSFIVPYVPSMAIVYACSITYMLWDQVRKYEDVLAPEVAEARAKQRSNA